MHISIYIHRYIHQFIFKYVGTYINSFILDGRHVSRKDKLEITIISVLQSNLLRPGLSMYAIISKNKLLIYKKNNSREQGKTNKKNSQNFKLHIVYIEYLLTCPYRERTCQRVERYLSTTFSNRVRRNHGDRCNMVFKFMQIHRTKSLEIDFYI